MKCLFLIFAFFIGFAIASGQSAQDLYKEGNDLLKSKQTEAAIAKYNKALALDSSLVAANMNRAKAYMELKNGQKLFLILTESLL